MKRIITILLAAFFCLCTQTYAQSRADELMKQAQESLAKKEYIKARYSGKRKSSNRRSAIAYRHGVRKE